MQANTTFHSVTQSQTSPFNAGKIICTPSPDNKTMTVLFDSFVAQAGIKNCHHETSYAKLNIKFNQSLSTSTPIQLDVRGDIIQTGNSAVISLIQIRNVVQTLKFDPLQATRFITTLPQGCKQFSVVFKLSARAQFPHAHALVCIDSLDIAFANP